MIILRYLTKEVLNAVLGVTLILLLILLSDQLVRFLSYAAAGKLSANILLQLMGFEIPYLLALLLPLGLYLGIIMAYGRLYADNEMLVIQGSGFSPRRLLNLTALLGAIAAIFVAILMLWMNPLIANKKAQLMTHSLSPDNILETLIPGRFQVSGDRVIYVESISRKHNIAKNVFIAEQKKSDTNAWSVVSAREGYLTKIPNAAENYMVATDGFRYEGVPGENAFTIIQFKKYQVRIPTTLPVTQRIEQEAIPSAQLLREYERSANAAELQWRISMPLSAFLLVLLAVPLSYVRPRQGRFLHFFPAILLYIIYINLLFVARDWVTQKMVPSYIGMWWVHLVMLVLVIVLLRRQLNGKYL